jgi:hypothetical protein
LGWSPGAPDARACGIELLLAAILVVLLNVGRLLADLNERGERLG